MKCFYPLFIGSYDIWQLLLSPAPAADPSASELSRAAQPNVPAVGPCHRAASFLPALYDPYLWDSLGSMRWTKRKVPRTECFYHTVRCEPNFRVKSGRSGLLC